MPGDQIPDRAEAVFAVAATGEVVGRYRADGLPGTMTAVVPATASGWVVSASAPGWWAPAVRLNGDAQEVSLTLVPEGLVRFELEAKDVGVEALAPSAVQIVGRLWRPGARLERGVYGGACALAVLDERRNLEVTCPFARGETADLSVKLGPFLPWVRAGVTVGHDRDFGLHTPVRGAEVFGSLSPGADEGPFLLALAPRNGAFPATAWTDVRGAFAFEGIATGVYDLYLERSHLDRWPTRVDSLLDRVDMGEIVSAAMNEFTLELFAPPGLLELEDLAVSAYRVEKDDDDRPRSRMGARRAAERSFDGSSLFHWSGLPAGSYRVFVESSWGNRWLSDVVEFAPSGRRTVEVDAVRVRGRIRRGSEPLENVLVWFGGLRGGQRIVFRTQHDGRFGGYLPRRLGWVDDWGVWGVEVTATPPCDPCEGEWTAGSWGGFDPRASVADAGVVEIVEDVDGVARVDINLPDGRIAGKVVRADEEAVNRSTVPGARVRLTAQGGGGGEWSALASETGTFEFLGVPEGDVELTATASVDAAVLRSDAVSFRLADGDVLDDLEVVLRSQRRFGLLVRSGGSAVRRAVAVAHYTDPSRGRVSTRRTTRGDGFVTFWLPRASGPVDLVVHAEGLGSDGWRFQAPPPEEVEVELFGARGELLVPRGSEALIINSRGVAMALSSLRSNGQTRDAEAGHIVRNLAPGHYSYCPNRDGCTEVQIVAGVLNEISDESN